MSDEPQVVPLPLTEDDKALLRRCYRIRKITDDEIVFLLVAPSVARAALFTVFWFVLAFLPVTLRWVESDSGPTLSWLLLGVFPTFFLLWLADYRRRFLTVRRGARAMTVDLGDRQWTIHLPRGSSPADWGFPTASVPTRMRADEVECVNANEILERFSGSSLSEEAEKTFLPLLDQCGADVVGYDEGSVSLGNFGSGRGWVVGLGLTILAAAPPIGFALMIAYPTSATMTAVLAETLSALGACWVLYDGRRSSVATFRKGKREILLCHRGIVSTHDVHESAVRIISGGEPGESLIVPPVFSCSPNYGTADLLAGFLRKYLAPPKKDPATKDT